MTRFKKLLWFAFIMCFAAVPVLSAGSVSLAKESASDEDDDGVLVGRIAHVDGQLLRFVPAEKDWVATVKDAPFGLDDALYAGDDAKAEFIMPNNTWARIGASTQIQMIALKGDVTEMDVASGVARFYNRSSEGVIKTTTPFGYVMAPAGTIFDLYVGDESVEVIAIKGSVDYIHNGDQTKYEVKSGSASIIADSRQVTSGEGNVDADWDNWNVDRDQLWNKRLQVKGDSVKYLPSQLQDDAHTLEENGRWETVQYEGQSRRFWRPSTVSADWAPFTAGRWTEWYGDQTWIPAEPFGYVTHHYGNWVLVNNMWYWSPPVVRVRPVVGIGFGWYPGRVAWISSGVDVGWVPLAPREVYYSHYRWGRRAVVINSVSPINININIGRFAYVNRAIVVRQDNFYKVNNYRQVRITNINQTTIINNYRAAPVVNNTVINNYNTNRQRFNFTDVTVNNKPHQSVVNRIQRNENIAKQAVQVNARDIQRNVSGAKAGQVVRTGDVRPPKVTDKLVPASEVNKPQSEVRFKQKDLKQVAKPPRDIAGPQGPDTEGRPGMRQQQRPGQGQDVQPPDVGKPGRRGQQPTPGQPSLPGEPGEGKDRVRPPKAGQEAQPDDVGRPRRPGQPAQPGDGTERVRPARPGERVQPGETGRPGQADDGLQRPRSPRAGERTQPGEPGRPGQADDGLQRPRSPRAGERMQPGEPGRPGQADDGLQRPRSPRAGERMQPGESGRPGQAVQPEDRPQRMRPDRSGERMQPGGDPGMQGQGGQRMRPQRDQMPSGEMGQPQRPRQQMQEPGMRRQPAEQQAPRDESGRQVPPEEKRKKHKDEVQL